MTEDVARQRRALPLGGRVPEDYVFEEMTPGRHGALGDDVRALRAGERHLIVYNYMYGPAMAKPCVMCTSIVDALDASAQHVNDRMNLVVVAKSPIERIMQEARRAGLEEGSLRELLERTPTTAITSARMKRKASGDGERVREEGRRPPPHLGSELIDVDMPGGEGRHVDIIWPLWNLFDWTPEGRGTDWHPKLQY